MKKFYYLGLGITAMGTAAFIATLVQHIQNPATNSIDLLLTSCIICLGAVITNTNKYQRG